MGSNRIITIARQYGSGGKTVGQMLAKDLGIDCYDREILRMASDDSGLNLQMFGNPDERRRNTFLTRAIKKVYKGEVIPPDSDDFASSDNLFNYQAKVVNDLAEKESYVIVGRCVNYVFKDRPNTLRVYIHAPWEFRVEQASQKISGSREDVEKFLLKDDKRKQDYYRKFAGGQWSDATNYDLCLNSGKLGFDKCVDAIETQLKIMLGK